MTVVLILGAGFSRAISDAAPLTDELGNLVVSRMSDDRLPAHPRGFEGGSFEVWLSRLGEDQPDLSVEANLLNRYWFACVTNAVHEIIAARELEILAADPPTWLLQLLGIAHARRMTVITFNYDTLVEQAVMVHQLFDWEHKQRATWHDIVDYSRRYHLNPPGGVVRQRTLPIRQAARLCQRVLGTGRCLWRDDPPVGSVRELGAARARRPGPATT